MILGCIADDFTGGSDIAGILAAEGMSTALLTDPGDIAGTSADAGVLALKTRSIPADEAIAQSLAALERFRAAGCRQIFFKYCSTFDSTPAGNIGPVAKALAEALGATRTVVCPAFPANGRTVYLGHLFVGDVLLSESGMRDHPVTPMTDSDIRRWLARQAGGAVGHVAHPIVREGAQAIAQALGEGLVVVDAIDDGDLRAIGRAVAGDPLVTGGSALAMGLPDNFRAMGMSAAVAPTAPAAIGPAIVLAGSCSIATNRQVARYVERHPAMPLDVDALMAGAPVLEACDHFLIEHAEDAPLIYSTAAPAVVGAVQARYDAGVVADRIEHTLSELARRGVTRGVKRIVVAGGETSGAVTMAVRPGPLKVGPMIAPGVPALGNGDIALALKSGNFGDDDFLLKAVAALGRAS